MACFMVLGYLKNGTIQKKAVKHLGVPVFCRRCDYLPVAVHFEVDARGRDYADLRRLVEALRGVYACGLVGVRDEVDGKKRVEAHGEVYLRPSKNQ